MQEFIAYLSARIEEGKGVFLSTYQGPGDPLPSFEGEPLEIDEDVFLKQLKELYEACDDVGDRLLEAALGICGGYIENNSELGDDYQFGNLRYEDGCIEKIIDIREEAATLAGNYAEEGIKNILGDFCETCDSVIYKLKRLK